MLACYEVVHALLVSTLVHLYTWTAEAVDILEVMNRAVLSGRENQLSESVAACQMENFSLDFKWKNSHLISSAQNPTKVVGHWSTEHGFSHTNQINRTINHTLRLPKSI